jgi:hypothetical protein
MRSLSDQTATNDAVPDDLWATNTYGDFGEFIVAIIALIPFCVGSALLWNCITTAPNVSIGVFVGTIVTFMLSIWILWLGRPWLLFLDRTSGTYSCQIGRWPLKRRWTGPLTDIADILISVVLGKYGGRTYLVGIKINGLPYRYFVIRRDMQRLEEAKRCADEISKFTGAHVKLTGILQNAN